MILEEATFEKYGYYSTDISPQSHKKILAACDECGKVREIYKSKYRDLCIKCTRKGKRNVRWTGGLQKRICLECDKEFRVAPSVVKAGHGLYCSKECGGAARTKFLVGEKSTNWRGGKVKCICLICKKEFTVNQGIIRRGWGKYCSQKCQNIGYSLNHSGENGSRWEGGKSFEPYCYKFNSTFKEYIRNKFDRKCYLCDKTEEENGQRLSVHHCDYNKNCGCADTEEDKKVEDKECQFIPLCRSCHSKVHGNRDKWERYFMDKLHNKLNGWYI